MRRILLLSGEGIGPEVTSAAVKVVGASGAAVTFEKFETPRDGDPFTAELLAAAKKTGAVLKGPFPTPIGQGYESVNVRLRRALGLFANVRPTRSMPGVHTPFPGVDLVIIRENTEDLYAGIEGTAADAGLLGQRAPKTARVSLKVTTPAAVRRICEFAVDYAKRNGRKKITAVHKANILKLTDGLFLETARTMVEAAGIAFEDLIVDNAAQQLVLRPQKLDVLLCPNLYGDVLSDLAAALVGGLGLAPSVEIGKNAVMAEAVHGTAPDIAGKGIANPTATILSCALLLRHIGHESHAVRIEGAVHKMFASGKFLTRDLGGTADTAAFTDAVIKAL